MNKIPSDPFILLSFINTKLRDFYSNLDEACLSLNVNKEELIKKLSAISYSYDENLNKFV